MTDDSGLEEKFKAISKVSWLFQTIQKIGKVACKLNLPKTSKIYPVFHVSCLKKKLGAQVVSNPNLPSIMEDKKIIPELEKIIESCLKKKGNRARAELLV